MDTRTALRVLIESSDLKQEDKDEMIAAIPEMTDEEVRELGTALAKQKKEDAAAAKKAMAAIDKMLVE